MNSSDNILALKKRLVHVNQVKRLIEEFEFFWYIQNEVLLAHYAVFID